MAKSKETPQSPELYPAPEVYPVEVLAGDLPAWELAALRQAAGWPDGKQVSEAAFTAALDKLRIRPQGGGTI